MKLKLIIFFMSGLVVQVQALEIGAPEITTSNVDAALEDWRLPDSRLRYDQVTYLCAHNAFSSVGEGWTLYQQQKWSIKEQLDNGVRVLMLDTYDFKNDVYLCHGSCEKGFSFQLGVKQGFEQLGDKTPYKKLSETLSVVRDWLKNHPKEIVTINLENYANPAHIMNVVKNVGLESLTLLPKDWVPEQHNGEWPTLQWLQDHNKRLLIFDSKGDTPFYNIWQYTIENEYSELDPNKVCKERGESRNPDRDPKRKLYLFNYFGGITSPNTPANLIFKTSEENNSYNRLMQVIKGCRNKNNAGNKNPNQIALDFVDAGKPMQVVNEFNREAEKALKR